MDNTLPLRRPCTQLPHHPRIPSPSPPETPSRPVSVSTIRLISAAPSAAGSARVFGDACTDNLIPSSPFVSVSPPTPLAPKHDTQAPRRRLVPKKSKLGLLVTRKSSKTEEKNDLSDVVRRAGGSSISDGGFEIYVDPTAQSEVNEPLMVKKKKSRAALSGLKWGTLGEVTNTALSKNSVQTVRQKNDDKERWWSIGRGRKDTKGTRIAEKENAPLGPSESPTEAVAFRARFNSLGSPMVLKATSEGAVQVRPVSPSEPPFQDSDLLKDPPHVSTTSSLLLEDAREPPLSVPPNSMTGSIAIRAMRSMRSMARLANWANGKSVEKETTSSALLDKKEEPPEAKKKKTKRRSESGKGQVISRLSVGGSSDTGVIANHNITPTQASTARKHGVLGLGLPSALRFGTVRSSSAGLFNQGTASSANSLSRDGRSHFSSTVSAASSLRPNSSKSRISSSGSAPVKWVETVKGVCRRERVAERRDEAQCDSSRARSRSTIVDMFPDMKPRTVSTKSTSKSSAPTPIPTVKGASAAALSVLGSGQIVTPRRHTRARPASDQMIEKERLRNIQDDTDSVLSALDAATNELASLISRLDLEATPNTPACNPRLSPSFTTSFAESPRLGSSSKIKDLPEALPIRPDTASQTSDVPDLRSQNEVALNTQRYGQQIAPWPVSPLKPLQVSPGLPPDAIIASVCEHLTEPPVVLPVKTNKPTTVTPLVSSTPTANTSDTRMQHPLSRTFRKMMSTLSLRVKGSESSLGPDVVGLPMSNEVRKDLGLAGTLGGSMSPRNLGQSMDPDDPDSDIPNELQAILIGRGAKRLDDFEDTHSSLPTHKPPSPGLPPEGPLPTPVVPQGSIVFPSRPAPWMEGGQLEDRDGSDSSSLGESDTKRSFDFTGELKKLSESSATHRRSFVEQLEGAFRTPAKYDLDGFGQFGRKEEVIPPIPPISFLSSGCPGSNESNDPHAVASVPPLLPSPEIIVPKKRGGATSLRNSSRNRAQKSSASPKPSYGQLDLSFKFGGTPPSAKSTERSHLTLSDIIPSPAHARSLSMTSLKEDNPTRSPNLFQTLSAPSSYSSSRDRVDSISNRPVYVDPQVDTNSSHSRASSQTSFKGFESFDEIRRGFEFAESRPPFYPPSSFNNRCNQQQRDSMISIASVSSYGIVINPGVKDPFDYGRPTSGDASGFMTMSTSIDDTFSFIRRHPRRKRVDSDSSSFYFRPPGVSLVPRPLKTHFRPDSLMSIASLAPPVSIYNRSFGVHRRIDSFSSFGSGAQPCAPYGFAGGNRSSWAPSHQREMSADSVMSDMSVRVPRPALGDKMLDSKHDYCLPLTSIAASPPESVTSILEAHMRRQDSFDSILDDESHSYSRDSIMDQSKSSHKLTSESVFGRDWSQVSHSPLDQFNVNSRPFSLLSAESDSFDPKREDDTMITMLGGGRVHRRSIGSFVEGSPIFIRIGKRRATRVQSQRHKNIQLSEGAGESPDIVQHDERSPRGLGEERMIFARQGLLSRDSLEEHCLCADGVDTSFLADPVFSRPIPVSRSRSGTHSSISSGVDTPALSSSTETSSVASESISSIDLSRVNLSLTNMSYPLIVQSRTRIRSKGHGHHRRLSISRSSVYETIEEEENNTPIIDRFPDFVKAPLFPVIDDNVIIVDPDDASAIEWDERGVAALRKYFSLKDEADVAIEESKQLWLDTPFSIYAAQSFKPPAHRAGMRALLEHSQQTFGPISAELRRIRSRTSSRASPYPQPQRAVRISLSPSAARPNVPVPVPTFPISEPEPGTFLAAELALGSTTQVLQQRAVNLNTVAASEMSLLAPGKSAKGDSALPTQSRFGSNARRNTDGWPKRGIGKENKEHSGMMSALRLNRPRPRGRPAARAIAPVGA